MFRVRGSLSKFRSASEQMATRSTTVVAAGGGDRELRNEHGGHPSEYPDLLLKRLCLVRKADWKMVAATHRRASGRQVLRQLEAAAGEAVLSVGGALTCRAAGASRFE